MKYNVGDVSPLVAKGNELVFWGVAGNAASPPKKCVFTRAMILADYRSVRNITIDNTFESMPAADSALHPINLTFSSDWQQLYGQGAGLAQTSMGVDTVGAAYNTSIATTTKKGAKMTFTAHGMSVKTERANGATQALPCTCMVTLAWTMAQLLLPSMAQ